MRSLLSLSQASCRVAAGSMVDTSEPLFRRIVLMRIAGWPLVGE